MSVQLIVVGFVVIAGYLISLRLHPYAKCRACGGSSKHSGAVFRYGFRACRRCEGKGRKPRLGSRVFHPDLK